MSNEIFENARPIITGVDDHDAELSGSVVSELTVNQSFPAPVAAVSCTSQAVNFTTIGSTSVNITHAKNEIFIRGQAEFRLSSSNRQEVRIIRDNDEGDVLNSLVTARTTSGTWALSTTILNETVGAHTYQWQIKMQSGQAETCCVQNTTFYNMFSEADDNHQADLIGANTQINHESGVLP